MKTITLKMRGSAVSGVPAKSQTSWGGIKHYAGPRGEHRMTELIIPLPLARRSDIQSCVALFSCDDQLALSPLILPDSGGDCFIQNGKAHVILWQRLTQCWVLRVQL